MRTLGLVPARRGSKRLPGKNIRRLRGKPLLAYTAEAALRAERLTAVVLSTDDPQIAEIGRTWGLAVPFLRPANLAQDGTPMLEVVRHALGTLQTRGEVFDAVCLLQPTHPLRRSRDIDACIDLLEHSNADAVVTVLPVPPAYNPCWVYFPNGDGFLRLSVGERDPIASSQHLPQAVHREGSVYVTRRRVVMEDGSLYGRRLLGYLLDPKDCVNIDSPEDWQRAARLVGKRT
jgi:CMP-N-acetylneuraminic acid synthetase